MGADTGRGPGSGGEGPLAPPGEPEILAGGREAGGDRFAATLAERPAPPPPLLARGIAAQIAEAARGGPGAPVEIILSPQELGAVRMTLRSSEHAISITLVADRPETLDLMRRHSEILEREFRDAGYSDIAFSFAQSGGEDRPRGAAALLAAAQEDPPAAPGMTAAVYRLAPHAASGLDLRL
jgi:hypothetical protein